MRKESYGEPTDGEDRSAERSKAIGQAKKNLIQDHLDHCLEDVVGPLAREQRRSIDEFKEIAKYL